MKNYIPTILELNESNSEQVMEILAGLLDSPTVTGAVALADAYWRGHGHAGLMGRIRSEEPGPDTLARFEHGRKDLDLTPEELGYYLFATYVLEGVYGVASDVAEKTDSWDLALQDLVDVASDDYKLRMLYQKEYKAGIMMWLEEVPWFRQWRDSLQSQEQAGV